MDKKYILTQKSDNSRGGFNMNFGWGTNFPLIRGGGDLIGGGFNPIRPVTKSMYNKKSGYVTKKSAV